jgi:hypothetical protein
MYCRSGLVFGGTEGVGSRFHVLRARTPFRRYRGRRLPFSCFARLNSFLAVPCESDPVLMFCALVLVFSCTVGVGSHFHVWRSRTHFRRNRGRRFPFSCFALPDSLSAVPTVSGLILMFRTPGLIFGCTEGVRSHFHVLRARTRFRPYRGRRVPFTCFALPDSFSAVTRASGPVSMFCAPALVFCCTEGFGSRFHVLCS